MTTTHSTARPVVHLELHTPDRSAAAAFYEHLFDWRPERIQTRAGSYLALELGRRLGGGIVECGSSRGLWLPYVEVDQIAERTGYAQKLGAQVLLEPREGPTGWRSVICTHEAGEIAFWQPKR
jgi:predicted enzyme related to lactoylglutathione lyase